MIKHRHFFLSATLLLAMSFFLGGTAFAQQGQPNVKSQKTIKRTAYVMVQARAAVKKGQVFTGKLAQASNHQNYAIQHHRQQRFVKAMFHSMRARHLAMDAMKANSVAPPMQLANEPGLPLDPPSDADLDQDLDLNFDSLLRDDEDVLESNDAYDLMLGE